MAICTLILFFIKTDFTPQTKGVVYAKALVLETDNSNIIQHGIIKTGTQAIKLKILNTKYKNTEYTGYNQLIGKLELDKFFAPENRALVSLEINSNGTVHYVNIIDHYRISVEIILVSIFIVFLLLFAGYTGLKAIISFLFTFLIIFKITIPLYLKGYNPLLLALVTVVVLTAGIIFLVAGFSRKGFTAFAGSIAGIILTALLSLIFGKYFKIHGAVKPFSETLLYSGYGYLNLNLIFLSSIFIASSGAVMDIAMDIAASMDELISHHPGIKPMALLKSGLSVGKSVIGTMTTTLLLAYSGGYITLLMVFTAQRVPYINLFTLNYIASEILHTLVGSFGLISVAPLTAVLGTIVYKKSNQKT